MCLSAKNMAVFVLAYLLGCVHYAFAGCYFPLEFQGEFLTQSLTSREIAYSSLSVLFDSVGSWGQCHRRIGHHVILMQGHEEQGDACYRCFRMESRSPNVLQLHASPIGGFDACHASEDLARARCPTLEEIANANLQDADKSAKEMMLYKTRSFYGGSAVTRVHCPINGQYSFTYSVANSTEASSLECAGHESRSEASDCPTGYKFDLSFKGCSFPDFEMSFQCLGSWPGQDGQTYMSLLDTKLPQLGEEPRPRYRCALFKEDASSGITHVALSSDSTCINNLRSSRRGYETLQLAKKQRHSSLIAPQQQQQHQQQQQQQQYVEECVFPDWMQGEWEDVTVSNGDLVYRDGTNFVRYSGRCIRMHPGHPDRFIVQMETGCGQRSHRCLLFQQRDRNVMEFQLGFSESDNADTWLCNADNFSPTKWLTQGRRRVAELPHCPLAGEWAGVLPDAEGLCARSYADCNNPEVMFYNVFSCKNESEVYEEREYRCFGTWTEGGLVYTYAERRDLPGNECFVGEETGVDTNVVTEAGANCERGHQPRRYGMTLKRQGKCNVPPPAYSDEQEEELEEMVREEEDESSRAVSPRLRTTTERSTSLDWPSDKVEQHHKKHHRHHNRDRDILTNEIAGSSSSSSSASFSSRSSAVSTTKAMQVLMTALVVFVWTISYGTRTT